MKNTILLVIAIISGKQVFFTPRQNNKERKKGALTVFIPTALLLGFTLLLLLIYWRS